MHQMSLLLIVLTAGIAISQETPTVHEFASEKRDEYLTRIETIGEIDNSGSFTNLVAINVEADMPTSTISLVNNKHEWKLSDGSLTMEGVYTSSTNTHDFAATLDTFDFELHEEPAGTAKVVKREFDQVILDSVVPPLGSFLEEANLKNELKDYMEMQVADGFKARFKILIDTY